MTSKAPKPTSSPTPRRQTAAGAETGALIGGVFGLIFLIINSSQFSSLGRMLVIALGAIVFAGILVFAVRGLMQTRSSGAGAERPGAERSGSERPGSERPGSDTREGPADVVRPGPADAVRTGPADAVRIESADAAKRGRREPPFGRAYWIIVLIEAIALFAGARLLTSLGHPELGAAWVAVVVGTHFFALGRVFGLDRFHVLATVVTLCGIGGFIAFFAAAPAFIPVISGVISGFVLLAFAMWALVPVEK